MIPPYTYVYPFKTLDEAEAPQTAGQCSAVAPPGYTRQNGGFHGLGGLLPLLVGGYAVEQGCAAGILPAGVCETLSFETPGKSMPGSCPEAYKVDGSCVCPKGSETADGGCTYEPGYTVDANGALPIGGSSTPTSSGPSTTTLWIAAAVAVTAAVVLLRK